MDVVPLLASTSWLSERASSIVLHVVVITLVPLLFLVIFLSVRVSTQLALYFAGSWSLRRMPRYKDPLAAWKILWNTVDWNKFCAKMRKKDGNYHPMLNCGPSAEGRHWVAISSPDLIQTVLNTPEPDEETIGLYSKLRVASPTFIDAYTAWIGEGLLTSQGSKWHIHRKACMPLFFFTILQYQLDFVSQSTHDMIRAIRMDRPNENSDFATPTKRLSHHIMRCLLRLIAGEEVTREAQSMNSKHSIHWMVTQQHTLVHHFRRSLEKTSFLGGRVWHILGGPIANMLPWLGGEGNMHELQRERYSLACYFQSLINRLRYDEEEDDDISPTQNHDLLSILFHMKLDENFTIHYEMTRTDSAPQIPEGGGPPPVPAPHTPTPPLPSRRNLLKRSMSGLRRSTASLVITPPHSPSGSLSSSFTSPTTTDTAATSSTSTHNTDNSTTTTGDDDGGDTTPPVPQRYLAKSSESSASSSESMSSSSETIRTAESKADPSTSSIDSLHSKTKLLRNFKITSASNLNAEEPSSPSNPTSATATTTTTSATTTTTTSPALNRHDSPLLPKTGARPLTNADFSPLETLMTSSPNNDSYSDIADFSMGDPNSPLGWETSSDGSANEEDEQQEDEDAAAGGPSSGGKRAQNWSTMPYNSDAEESQDLEDDPECVPGSRPPRAGHLPDETIIDQAFNFMAAGFQPTVSTIEWCLYHLATDAEQHEKLQREAHLVLDGLISTSITHRVPDELQQPINKDSTPSPPPPHINMLRARAGSGLGLGDIRISPEHLSNMKHTRNFVKEVLRLHPTQPVIERITNDAVNLGGHKIPEGTAIGMMISNVHRDPSLWKHADQFWPERFESAPEPVTVNGPVNVPSHAYIPYSAGHHSCIGQKYVTQLVMVTVSLLVRAFQIEIDPDTEVKSTFFDGILTPYPLHLRFIPRNFTKSSSSALDLPKPSHRYTQIIPPYIPPTSSITPQTQTPAEQNPASKTPTLSRRSKPPL